MTCYHPLTAYQSPSGGPLIFKPTPDYNELEIPCGRCIGCRLDRSRQWALRCMHEASLHRHNCFVTLTYNEDHLPADGNLNYRHFQLFIKKLRKEFRPLRCCYYMCGEYGESLNRPHYHACIFGIDFPDKYLFRQTDIKNRLYRSPILERLWHYGHSSIGALTYKSAGYVARYCLKKITGVRADDHYTVGVNPDTGEILKRVPEFAHMSTRPAIAKDWLERYIDDVYPNDYLIVDGHKAKVPGYFDRKFVDIQISRGISEQDAMLMLRDIKELRQYKAYRHHADNSPDRLAVREEVTRRRVSKLQRPQEC